MYTSALLIGLSNCSSCRGRLQNNTKVAPAPTEVQQDQTHDLPTDGFAAPVRDGQPPPHTIESSGTMARLDELLSSIGTSMEAWDGDGVFAPGGGGAAAGTRRMQGMGISTRAGGAGAGGRGCADVHADWSRDGAGYFGGTAVDYDDGVAPGSGLGGGAAGQPMSQELEEQVQALKAALEAAKKKLARSREAEGALRAKHDEKARLSDQQHLQGSTISCTL